MREKNKCHMIDIHCHILPGIDDGSKDVGMSEKMLFLAYSEGITGIVATPHWRLGRRETSRETIAKLLAGLYETARKKGIDIVIKPGLEVFYFSEISELLEEHKLQEMNDTDRVLVEFMPNEQYSTIRNSIDDILGAGYIPIVAHIERYACFLENPQRVNEIKDLGAEVQINVSSAMGAIGPKAKRFVRNILRVELPDYVGTDAHDVTKRAPKAQKFMKMAYKKYDHDYIDAILYKNAKENLNFK